MQVTLTKPRLRATGTGNSKKEAKQAAARAMLVKLDKEVKEMKTSCPQTPASSSAPLIRVPLTSSSSSDQNRTPFLCRPCQVECTSKVSLEEHLKSKKHAKVVASV